jgi:hypothetical protein
VTPLDLQMASVSASMSFTVFDRIFRATFKLIVIGVEDGIG